MSLKTRTDWNKFSSRLEERYSSFLNHEFESLSLSEKYKFFTKQITDSVILASPSKPNSKKHIKHHNPVPWWDADCDKAKRLRRAAFKKWQHTNELADLINYKKQTSAARKLFKAKKKSNFREFAETINYRTSPTYIWNKSKIFKNKWTKIHTNVTQNL
jgi:hypothetical protein